MPWAGDPAVSDLALIAGRAATLDIVVDAEIDATSLRFVAKVHPADHDDDAVFDKRSRDGGVTLDDAKGTAHVVIGTPDWAAYPSWCPALAWELLAVSGTHDPTTLAMGEVAVTANVIHDDAEGS